MCEFSIKDRANPYLKYVAGFGVGLTCALGLHAKEGFYILWRLVCSYLIVPPN